MNRSVEQLFDRPLAHWIGKSDRDIFSRHIAEGLEANDEDRLTVLTANLEQRVEERTEQLRAMATELNLAEQRERKRLSVELHDYLQQVLVLSKLKAGQCKRFVRRTAQAYHARIGRKYSQRPSRIRSVLEGYPDVTIVAEAAKAVSCSGFRLAL